VIPATRYARSGDVHIAYQVIGDAPVDLIVVPTWISHLEYLWEEPRVADFLERVASFARVILFDRRGSGLSDPIAGAPTLESQMDDVLAVMDAAGSRRAALFAQLEGGAMALLFAATHAERTSSLALFSSWARLTRAPDYDCGEDPQEREAMVDGLLSAWGSGRRAAMLAPSCIGDPEFRHWFGRLERFAASPGTAKTIMELIGRDDVREVLDAVNVPTLVMNRRDDALIDPCHSRYLAARIAGARHVELPGRDTLFPFGDITLALEELEELVTGGRAPRASDRVLATVMFTDIVGSTELAAQAGDLEWRRVLDRHDRVTAQTVDEYRGHKVKSTGDGLLATFDGPARAIRCAQELVRRVKDFGLSLRVGLHTGEIEVVGSDVAGVAVHLGARVCAEAGRDEILASSTVHDLVIGSGLEFADRGAHELRGVPGEWRLYQVLNGGEPVAMAAASA
jgi:class 3 adenylate cyclase